MGERFLEEELNEGKEVKEREEVYLFLREVGMEPTVELDFHFSEKSSFSFKLNSKLNFKITKITSIYTKNIKK